MRAVKSVSIDSERRVIITYLDGSTETLYPNCIWCDSEALRQLIKDLLEEKADAITQTIENVTIASFADGADEGLIKKLLVSINPIQDFHGYDNPWPVGGGKNIAPYSVENSFYVGYSNMLWENGYSDNEVISTSTGFSYSRNNTNYGCGIILGKLEEGQTYTLKATRSDIDWTCTIVTFDADAVLSSTTGVSRTAVQTNVNIEEGFTFTAQGGNVKYAVGFYSKSEQSSIEVSNIQLEKGQTPTEWTPYSNICPISGRTGLTIYHSGADTSDPTTLSVNWETEGGTVYYGTLDVVSGRLNIDGVLKTFVGAASEGWTYSGGSQPFFYCKLGDLNTGINSEVVCDTFPNNGAINTLSHTEGVYVLNSTAFNGFMMYLRWYALGYSTVADFRNWLSTNNVTIAYKLATPTEIQLTPQEITTLLGDNNIWADSGNILELEYTADTKLYIGEQQSASSGTLGMVNQPAMGDKQIEPVAEITDTDSEVTE